MSSIGPIGGTRLDWVREDGSEVTEIQFVKVYKTLVPNTTDVWRIEARRGPFQHIKVTIAGEQFVDGIAIQVAKAMRVLNWETY